MSEPRPDKRLRVDASRRYAIQIRVNEYELAAIRRQAEALGMTVSEYIRQRALAD